MCLKDFAVVVKHTKLQSAFGGGDLVKSKPLLKLVNVLVIAIMLLPACLSPVDAYIGNGIGGQDIAIYIGGQKLSFDTPPLIRKAVFLFLSATCRVLWW